MSTAQSHFYCGMGPAGFLGVRDLFPRTGVGVFECGECPALDWMITEQLEAGMWLRQPSGTPDKAFLGATPNGALSLFMAMHSLLTLLGVIAGF